MAHDLNITTIADDQADQQWQTSNDADADLANALADLYTVDFTAGNVTLTASQFRSANVFIGSNLSTTRVLTLPAVKRPFWVYNPDSTDVITVTKGSATVSVTAGALALCYTDGTTNGLVGAVIASAAGATSPYDIPLSFAGTPTTSQIIGKVIVTRDVDFAANFAGSYGHVGTNPTSTFAIDVKDDGTSIGTISVSTGGAFTFTTTSGTAKTVATGSRLEFVGPSSVDATVASIAATLHGSVDV